MKEYQLQARCLIGSLAAPERDECRLAEADDLAPLRSEAERLAREGFTVWLFRHGPATGPSLTPYKLHLVETLRPGHDRPSHRTVWPDGKRGESEDHPPAPAAPHSPTSGGRHLRRV